MMDQVMKDSGQQKKEETLNEQMALQTARPNDPLPRNNRFGPESSLEDDTDELDLRVSDNEEDDFGSGNSEESVEKKSPLVSNCSNLLSRINKGCLNQKLNGGTSSQVGRSLLKSNVTITSKSGISRQNLASTKMDSKISTKLSSNGSPEKDCLGNGDSSKEKDPKELVEISTDGNQISGDLDDASKNRNTISDKIIEDLDDICGDIDEVSEDLNKACGDLDEACGDFDKACGDLDDCCEILDTANANTNKACPENGATQILSNERGSKDKSNNVGKNVENFTEDRQIKEVSANSEKLEQDCHVIKCDDKISEDDDKCSNEGKVVNREDDGCEKMEVENEDFETIKNNDVGLIKDNCEKSSECGEISEPCLDNSQKDMKLSKDNLENVDNSKGNKEVSNSGTKISNQNVEVSQSSPTPSGCTTKSKALNVPNTEDCIEDKLLNDENDPKIDELSAQDEITLLDDELDSSRSGKFSEDELKSNSDSSESKLKPSEKMEIDEDELLRDDNDGSTDIKSKIVIDKKPNAKSEDLKLEAKTEVKQAYTTKSEEDVKAVEKHEYDLKIKANYDDKNLDKNEETRDGNDNNESNEQKREDSRNVTKQTGDKEKLDENKKQELSAYQEGADDEDLLQIMEVRGTDEPELEINKMDSNENSCSSSENRDEGVEAEESDKCDDNFDETPMEIEDLNLEKVLEGHKSNSNLDASKDQTLTNEDSDKENSESKDSNDDEPEIIETDVSDAASQSDPPKAQKRPLENDDTPKEQSKKIRLSPTQDSEGQGKYKILKLTSLSEYMLSKNIQKITRAQLEQLCLQKIAEAITSKSEIAELQHQLQAQEQIVDACRKETTQVAKQCRDLQLVQVKLMQELKNRRNSDKPIIPVKITRSVGLQAYVGEERRRVQPTPSPSRSTPTTPAPPNRTIQRQNSSPVVGRNNVATNVNKTTTTQQQRQQQITPIIQRNLNNAQRPIASPQTAKTASKGVIDLTDEDDKAPRTVNRPSPANKTMVAGKSPQMRGPAAATGPNNVVRPNQQIVNRTSTVKTIPAPPSGQRVMLLPVVNTKNVVLKMNTQVPNGVTNNAQAISLLSSQVRGVQKAPPALAVRNITAPTRVLVANKHPAPLPAGPLRNRVVGAKPVPPKPQLTISKTTDGNGILLQWKMPYHLPNYEVIASYQLYAYQETNQPPRTENWGKIGDVKALALPMAVTLTQFASGNRYFFAVRAVDVHERVGMFSDPQTILL